jgi:4-hydroxybenzoate polyprenyltransferase
MKKLLAFLVYSNVYAVVLIAALLLKSWVILNQDSPFFTSKVLLVLSATLFLYPLHRVYGLRSIPEAYKSERHRFAEKYKIAMYMLVIIGALLSLWFVSEVSLAELWMHIPVGLLALGYVLPVIPTRKGWLKLREVPFAKSVFIALVASYLTVVFPYAGKDDAGVLLSLFMSSIFFLLAVTIPFDIRDYGGDKAAGLATIPVRLGIEKAIKVALFANVLFTVLNFVAFFFFDAYSLLVFIALWVSEIVADVFIRKAKPLNNDLWYALAVEGNIILQSLLVLVAVYLTAVFA